MQAVSTPINHNMISIKKLIVAAVIIIVAIAGLYFYKEYNRKVADLSNAKVEETINAADLVTAFENDEAGATKKFAGKTVLVMGNVAEIINQQDTMLNIFLGDKSAISKVSCLMDMRKKEGFKNIVSGTQISIKGICTGFLADVEMNRCVIVNDNKF